LRLTVFAQILRTSQSPETLGERATLKEIYKTKCEIKLGKYDGTFQKSKTLPIHRWYPFIEGFGEHLVCEIAREFADKSTYLVDPFGGCRTALLVARRKGENAA